MNFVKDMGAGWNLGNSLDAIGPDETAWNNPKTTKGMIDAIAARGFKTIRVPVTWRMHMGMAPDYTIEPAWLDRVEQVVNYAFANNIYVIINTHHENEWIIPSPNQAENVTNRLNKVWTQIALRFKDYNGHLIFETLNEPRIEGTPTEWTGGTAEERNCVNQYNQAAVDAIRATGGKNTTRMIIIAPQSAANKPVTINALIVPDNDPNILISIHNYFPVDFSLDWGSDEDIEALRRSFDALSEAFTNKGRAVVIGEWGSINHGTPSARLEHAKHFAREASKRGMCPVWWDNGTANGFGIFNRRSLDWFYPDIADVIIEEMKK